VKYGYLAVEGPHDLAFVGRLLKRHGLDRVKMLPALDRFWLPLVPRTFPHREDLLKRVPVPTFFAGETHSVAVDVVEGDSGFGRSIKDSLDMLYAGSAPPLTGLVIVLDADSTTSVEQRVTSLNGILSGTSFPFPLAFPNQAGLVSGAPLHAGIFVLPDNQGQGTLESLLIECAKTVYPTLEAAAREYLDVVPGAPELDRDDRKPFGKPAGPSKALVACIAAVLKPGKAIQVSLQDNRWIEEPLARFPLVVALDDFLVSLFELG
jgi:hypothetical protein